MATMVDFEKKVPQWRDKHGLKRGLRKKKMVPQKRHKYGHNGGLKMSEDLGRNSLD